MKKIAVLVLLLFLSGCTSIEETYLNKKIETFNGRTGTIVDIKCRGCIRPKFLVRMKDTGHIEFLYDSEILILKGQR